MPVRHKFYFACQLLPTTLGFKKGFSASVMWHEAVWTASGQTHWVVMEVATCPGFSSFLLWYQNTSTRMNTDSHTGRAVHSGEKKKKKMLCGNRRRGDTSPFQLAQDAGSSMSYMWIRGVRETFHHHPFVSQPCRALGLSRDSWHWFDFHSMSGTQDFNTFVFSAISV